MSKTLTVGNDSFEFPLEGANAGWGSEVTDWAEAVSDALATVQKPNDILLTTAAVSNTATTDTNIVGFSFSTAEVKAIECRYFVSRVTTSPATNYVEVGYIEGTFDGSNWDYSIRTTGDAKIYLSILPSGQVQYRVDTITAATHVGQIKFEAKVINNT